MQTTFASIRHSFYKYTTTSSLIHILLIVYSRMYAKLHQLTVWRLINVVTCLNMNRLRFKVNDVFASSAQHPEQCWYFVCNTSYGMWKTATNTYTLIKWMMERVDDVVFSIFSNFRNPILFRFLLYTIYSFFIRLLLLLDPFESDFQCIFKQIHDLIAELTH